MCSGGSDWTCLQPGFPIRKSSDRSLVIDSPRLIADSYVLLRFLVPRHPPCALINLSHKDARVHCVVLKIRAAPRQSRCLLGMCAGGSSVTRVLQPISRPEVELAPEPSGPNNVSGAPARSTPFHCRDPLKDRDGLYLVVRRADAPNNRCSTLERLLSDIRTQTRLWIACATSAP
jgi:hypothetical protein